MNFPPSADIPDFSTFEEKLRAFFATQQDLHFAIIFGSYANGKNRPWSDLDIGIHLNKELSILEMGNMIGEIEDISKLKVDLLVLNEIYEKNSTIAYEIICNHKLIHSISEEIYLQFKTRTYLHYFDDEPLREMKKKSFQNRINANRIGESNFVI